MTHGGYRLIRLGVAPPGYEWVQAILDKHRADGDQWLRTQATPWEETIAESYARWQTVTDMLWTMVWTEGAFAKPRRHKQLLLLAREFDKTAARYRDQILAYKHQERSVTPTPIEAVRQILAACSSSG
jgi:hypothetical protein